jgi:hypothetical protein
MHFLIRAAIAVLILLPAAAPAAAQSVTGQLRDADRDRPLPGARLLLLDDDGISVDSTLTDREARYRLTAPRPGRYTIYFRIDGYAAVPSEPLHLAAGTTTQAGFRPPLVAHAAVEQMAEVIRGDARLQESLPELCGEPFRAWEAGLLVGTVRQRASRQPIAGATVTLLDGDDASRRFTVSGSNGVYVLCNVPPGTAVRLSIRTPDGASETTDVEIRPGTASWYDLPVGPRRR